jgi:hypothetical protein
MDHEYVVLEALKITRNTTKVTQHVVTVSVSQCILSQNDNQGFTSPAVNEELVANIPLS